MAGKPPDAASLHEAALNHMARYAATEASLARVLARRVERWGQSQENAESEEIARAMRRAKAEIPGVLARLKELGVLNDEAFAASRAKRLTREGKSHRATLAHLVAKGVKSPSLPEDPERELAAACAYLRRRRAGPFGDAPEQKILAAMARGGFAQSTARRAMALEREEAETLIKSLSTTLEF
ncbi:regulatory protein RecX [Acidocella aromatica]|uniref:Regulatory protein n=1 Tax=Acidocella aromatica TaxID=1303579 RepID=A0A840VD76_9PROT|nr:RecX family transcriptional regulator [Acidocella aromatica]MBB5373656.1 regulatory protein [Acidocella aromatica]